MNTNTQPLRGKQQVHFLRHNNVNISSKSHRVNDTSVQKGSRSNQLQLSPVIIQAARKSKMASPQDDGKDPSKSHNTDKETEQDGGVNYPSHRSPSERGQAVQDGTQTGAMHPQQPPSTNQDGQRGVIPLGSSVKRYDPLSKLLIDGFQEYNISKETREGQLTSPPPYHDPKESARWSRAAKRATKGSFSNPTIVPPSHRREATTTPLTQNQSVSNQTSAAGSAPPVTSPAAGGCGQATRALSPRTTRSNRLFQQGAATANLMEDERGRRTAEVSQDLTLDGPTTHMSTPKRPPHNSRPPSRNRKGQYAKGSDQDDRESVTKAFSTPVTSVPPKKDQLRTLNSLRSADEPAQSEKNINKMVIEEAAHTSQNLITIFPISHRI